MKPQLFIDIRILDGNRVNSFPGEVAVEGNRVKTAAKNGKIARTVPLKGDPVAALKTPQNCDSVSMIVKGGASHKYPGNQPAEARANVKKLTLLWE